MSLSSKNISTLIFLIAPLCLAPVLHSEESIVSSLHGIYCLFSVDDDRKMIDYLSLSSVKGVSFRYSWKKIETAKSDYSWDNIDENIQKASLKKKKVMLRILPGFHSPPWLREKGVQYLTINSNNDRRKGKFGERYDTPLPWDSKYLEAWVETVQALGNRYDSFQSIVLVHMAGPTVYSAEMHLPKGENRKAVEKAGYTKSKIVAAWKRVIDAYARSFPTKLLALNLAMPLKNDGAMEEILKYAKATLGHRLCVQGNFLSGKTKRSFHVYKYLKSFRDDETMIIGFQMAAPSGNFQRMGTWESAINKGLETGARYFEIYPGDCLNPENTLFFSKVTALN